MSNADVSVVVTAYNAEVYIQEAIDSLLDQSMDQDKYLLYVIDDGSTDATLSCLDKYTGVEKVTILSNENNRGIAYSINKCLDLVDTEFMMRFDADDVAGNNLIEELYSGIGSHAFCHPDMELFYEEAPQNMIYYSVKGFPYFFAAGVLFRTELFETCSYSDLFWEEFDLYLQIFEQGGTYIHLQKALFKHRIHGANMTANEDSVARGFSEIHAKWGKAILSKYGFTKDAVSAAYNYYFRRPEEEVL